MGILFQKRPKLTDIEGLNPIERYGLSQVTNTYDALKVYDDPKIPLDYIRETIAFGPPSTIQFIVDNR